MKNVDGLKGKTYEEKLSKMGLCSLAEFRLQLDLTECYKINNGRNAVNCATWFQLFGDNVLRQTRANSYAKNIIKPPANTEIRNFFLIA